MSTTRHWVGRRAFLAAALASIICGQLCSRRAGAQQWYISDRFNSLWNYTQGAGSATNSRSMSGLPSSINVGIAISPTTGKMYTLTTFTDNSLYTVNTTTGAATLVGATGLSNVIEGDLSFDPTTGQLYGMYNLLSPGNDQLFTINTTTGAASVIGTFSGASVDDPSGMAFDNSGQMWIVDSHTNTNGTPIPTLSEVNKATGAIENTLSLTSVVSNPVLGLAFNPLNGQLYLADGTGSFYQINTTTGAATVVGTTGVTASGLAFANVPEPTIAGILLCSGTAMLLRRRRRD